MQIDEYYVGEDGKRVTESWISVENEDYGNDESEPEYYWYYYGKNGKMTTSRWMTIEGSTYYFNEDGHMMTGELSLDGFNYYLGEEGDGKMKTAGSSLRMKTKIPITLSPGSTMTAAASAWKTA